MADTRTPGVSGKSRMARVLGRIMRMRGLRWMFHALPPTPKTIVLVNRGRKSGRLYKTPLSILAEDPERGEVFVSPMWSRDSDWYQNVIAGGLMEIHVRGEKRQVEWRELDEAEGRARAEAFRDAHPIYSRMIARRLARLNRLEGEPVEAVVRNLPMLGLRRASAYRIAAQAFGFTNPSSKDDSGLIELVVRTSPTAWVSTAGPCGILHGRCRRKTSSL